MNCFDRRHAWREDQIIPMVGEVNEAMADFLTEQTEGKEAVLFVVNSHGGYSEWTEYILELMAGIPRTASYSAYAASAAAILALQADERYVPSDGIIMLHAPVVCIYPYDMARRPHAKAMAGARTTLDRMTQRLLALGMPDGEEMRRIHAGEDVFIDPVKGVEWGLFTGIIPRCRTAP